MSVVKKIVITGGPCAGKTSSKSAILESVLKTGYIPIFVGETATEVKISGLDPQEGVLNALDFQRFLSKLQIAKEDVYICELEKSDKKFIIFYDRGLIDNKAYMNEETWQELLKELDITDLEVFKRYDLALHLVSAADGAEKYYTNSNNKARSESVEEAKVQERRNKEVYNGFPYIYYFGNETSFDEKINKIVGTVMSSIGMGRPILGSQKKFIVPKVAIEELNNLKAQKAHIVQSYLSSNFDSMERRVRKITYYGNTVYYYTKKDSNKFITKEVPISENEYSILLEGRCCKESINKTRWYFNYNNLYFQYDEFEFDGDFEKYAILEVQTTDMQSKIDKIPKCFKNFYDITDNKLLDNFHILIDKSIRDNFVRTALMAED